MGFRGGSSGSSAISSASDVALNSPANNEVLTYDNGTNKWKNAVASSGTTTWPDITGKPAVIAAGANVAAARNAIEAADDAAVVKLAGAQTVGGIKTFSSSPAAPTPSAETSDTTVATTAFVTGSIDDATGEIIAGIPAATTATIESYVANNNLRPIMYKAAGDPNPVNAPNGTLLVTIDSLPGMEVTVLTEGSSTTDGTTMSTASFTPASGAAIFVWIVTGKAAAVAQPSSAIGHASLTEVASIVNGTNVQCARVYRMTGTDSAGAITFTYASSMDSFAWKVVQVTGANTTPVRSNTSAGFSSTPSVTLTGASSNNITMGFFACNANRTLVPSAGYTALGAELHQVNASISAQAEYRLDGSATVGMTTDTSGTFVNIAIEVEAL